MVGRWEELRPSLPIPAKFLRPFLHGFCLSLHTSAVGLQGLFPQRRDDKQRCARLNVEWDIRGKLNATHNASLLLPHVDCRRDGRGSLVQLLRPRASLLQAPLSAYREGALKREVWTVGLPPHLGFLPPAGLLMRSKLYRPSSDHSCFPRNALHSIHSQIQTLLVLLPESSTLHTHILSQSFPHRLPLSEAFSGFPGPQGQKSILLGSHSAPSWSPRPSSPARREHSLSPNSLFTCLHTFPLKSSA